jgi:MoaA/NifB/PqqE/SkfB family radical SAM enzyme
MAPLTLQWDLTYDCNSTCIYCRSKGFKQHTSDGCFSLSQIEKIIARLANWNFRRVKLLGGEPLVYRHLLDVISLCRKDDIKTTLFTNTRLIDCDVLLALKRAGLNDIIFSVDSMDECENNFLRGDLAYQSTVHALSCFQKLYRRYVDLPQLHINSTLSKVNKGGVLKILDLCHDYPVATYNFSLLDSGPIEPELFDEIALNEEEIVQVIESILIKSFELGIKSFVSGLKPLAALYFSQTCGYEITLAYSGCKGGYTNFFMYPDGNMWPCQRTAKGYNTKYREYKYKSINVLDNSAVPLRDEWLGFRKFVAREDYLKSWPCNTCKFAYWICRPCSLEETVCDMTKVGVCYAVAKKIGKDLNGFVNDHHNCH